MAERIAGDDPADALSGAREDAVSELMRDGGEHARGAVRQQRERHRAERGLRERERVHRALEQQRDRDADELGGEDADERQREPARQERIRGRQHPEVGRQRGQRAARDGWREMRRGGRHENAHAGVVAAHAGGAARRMSADARVRVCPVNGERREEERVARHGGGGVCPAGGLRVRRRAFRCEASRCALW